MRSPALSLTNVMTLRSPWDAGGSLLIAVTGSGGGGCGDVRIGGRFLLHIWSFDHMLV